MNVLNKYIGIPFVFRGFDFAGADCWGLVRLFYLYELSIKLPCFTIADNSSDCIEEKVFTSLDNFQEKPIETTTTNDILLFNFTGQSTHIGVAISPDYMLHTMQGHNSCMEQFTKDKWKTRAAGAYKWKSK